MSDARAALLAWGEVPDPGLLGWIHSTTAVDLVTVRAILAARRRKAKADLLACTQAELERIDRLSGLAREWNRRIIAISKELDARLGATAPVVAKSHHEDEGDAARPTLFES
jgi:hypothetical protein